MTIDWSEMSRHGGMTGYLLSAMHQRARNYRRKLAHNTYSYATFDATATPPCPDDWCPEHTGFSIRLHGNEIGLVRRNMTQININTVRGWPTVTTMDRVNNLLLSQMPYRVSCRNGKVHVRDYDGNVFLIDGEYADRARFPNYVIFNTKTKRSVDLWLSANLIETRVERPPINDLPVRMNRRDWNVPQAHLKQATAKDTQ